MREQTDSDRTDCSDTEDDASNDETRQNGGQNGDSADAAGGWTQIARRHYDPDDATDLTTVVVTAIAAAEGVPPRDVRSPVLYEHVDVSTVADVFFGPTVTERGRRGRGRIEFRYEGYRVEVASDGRVTVSEQADAASADGPE